MSKPLLLGLCDIDPSVAIGPYTVVGLPPRPNLSSDFSVVPAAPDLMPMTTIRSRVYIGSNVVIEAGVFIAHDCIVDSHSVIESGAQLGASTLVIHGARIGASAQIGSKCVIGGFVAERCSIGIGARVFGQLMHSQDDPTSPWDESVEPAPILRDNVFVGMGAKVIGGVTLEDDVYICAGATVTRSVPTGHVVRGINDCIPYDSWRGSLSKSKFWSARGR